MTVLGKRECQHCGRVGSADGTVRGPNRIRNVCALDLSFIISGVVKFAVEVESWPRQCGRRKVRAIHDRNWPRTVISYCVPMNLTIVANSSLRERKVKSQR